MSLNEAYERSKKMAEMNGTTKQTKTDAIAQELFNVKKALDEVKVVVTKLETSVTELQSLNLGKYNEQYEKTKSAYNDLTKAYNNNQNDLVSIVSDLGKRITLLETQI